MKNLPTPGTPEFDAFVKRASIPGSIEDGLVKAIFEEEFVRPQIQLQEQLRIKLQQMIELVPGQLFRDVVKFHEKFELSPVEEVGHRLPSDLASFRLQFMLEELGEYAESIGWELALNRDGELAFHEKSIKSVEPNMEKAFDGLIDLVYVALGTAFLHGFPFNDGWDRVQRANMAKERATSADDERSTRKHSADIVKPKDWVAPTLRDLLRCAEKEEKDG